jgi:hypothetical protein
MNGIHTPIPVLVIALWSAVAVLLVVVRHGILQPAVRRRSCWTITLLRLAGLALLAVLLLQPYRDERLPDREAFRTVVLLDASASMTVQDVAGGRSRLDLVRAAATSVPGARRALLDRLQDSGRTEVSAFAESVRPLRSGIPVPMLPGRTAIGNALADLLDRNAGPPLGAVLLLSDGHNNQGASPTEVCKLFRAKGIPVSCVGLGESRQPGDLRVRFAAEQLKGRKGEALTLEVLLENRFEHPVTTRLTVSDAQGVAAEREVTIAAGATQHERVEVTPLRAGYVSYSARVQPVVGDGLPDTDTDYAGVEVREPDRFGILYLGAHLGWEYRFLRLLCDSHPQLSLATVIQSGKTTFYQSGVRAEAEGRLDGFPTDPDTVNRFDAVVLDTRAIPALGPKGVETLVNFVDRRGGGLLVLGPLDDLPEALRDLLPLQPVAGGSFKARERLEVNPEFIFEPDPARALDPVAGLPVPPGGPVWLTSALKRGARPAAELRQSELKVLSAQAYGSGRVAYLGLESTWSWRLANDAGESSHSAFWNALLVWLSSTGKPRLRIVSDGAKVGLGDALPLDLDVMGSDFLPAPDARVTAALTTPSGQASEITLDAAAETAGHYTGVFFPEEAGEYRVTYRVESPTGTLTQEAHFLARRTGVETEDTAYREDVLRDMARVTGGAFYAYGEMDQIERLPLSRSVPMKTTRLYWTRHAALLLALAAVLGAEWLLRRRLGLK